MRKILIVTGTRAEYGLLYWTMKKIQQDKELQLQLIVTGNHLISEYGFTVKNIENDGFYIDEKIDMLINSENKSAILKSMGIEMIQIAQSLDRLKPDIMLVLGDRYETFIAVTCAMMMNIPIAHMNGGESTEGAIDEQIRHAITKMAHIHFPGSNYYKERILKMGEEPWRVFNVGQAGVENIEQLILKDKNSLEKELNINFNKKVFLITYHPVTLETKTMEEQIQNLLSAIEKFDAQYIFTYPNADFGSSIIIKNINKFVNNNRNATIYYNLGQVKYLSLMKYCDVVIGNSSSGILEAPCFRVPVVNIGNRQLGRVRSDNIIDVGYEIDEIKKGINTALFNKEFRNKISCINNTQVKGRTSEKVVSILKDIKIDSKLMMKKLTY